MIWLGLMVLLITAVYAHHPAVEIIKQFQAAGKQETIVIPHAVNTMALELLKQDKARHLEKVRAYIHWYLAHLNYADKYDITGSMYDYMVYPDGREKSLLSSDGISRYASTYLLLLGRYLRVSGDVKFFETNRKKLEDLAYNIPFLQGENGLIRTFPKQEHVFLLDNCEAYAGLSAAAKIADYFKWTVKDEKGKTFQVKDYYLEIRDRVANGILTHLYDSRRKRFYKAIINGKKHVADWKRLYPDAFVQLAPVVFDVLSRPRGEFARQKKIRKSLWKRFRKYYKNKIRQLPVQQRLIYRWTGMYMKGKKLWPGTKRAFGR
jgi:hypothetical protein